MLCFCACAAIPACAALKTAEIQSRIDAASAAGGGEVLLEAGEYEVGGLYLKNNVTLHLARGARLVASTNHLDYAGFPKYEHQRAVVSGISVTNVAIVGEGEIDGRGWAAEQKNAAPNRWKNVIFYRAKNVRVEGITLRDPASWTCYFKQCDGVTVRKVTIRSLVNHNNDGFDIEAKNVLIEDCDIEAEDDAVCFKSDHPDFAVENCLVRRCRVSSNCNFIKFGTSSCGIYRDVVVEDCHVECRSTYQGLDWRGIVPGVTNRITGISGIALEVVDGGVMENITVRNITMGAGVQTPIFIRQGARRPPKKGRPSVLKNILIENVRMSEPAASRIACSITGVPGLRPNGITIRSCSLLFPGGGTKADVERRFGEAERRYPENRMFGKDVSLPAYGFYVRHADGVRFENVNMAFVGATEERPALVKEDSTGVEAVQCNFKQPTGEYPVIYGVTAEGACASKNCKVRDAKPLKVLMIGNSFTGSVMRETPKLAKAAGLGLDIVQCGIGGCQLSRHWSNVKKSCDGNFKPYGVSASLSSGDVEKFPRKANVTDMLVADKWDIVTIQQASDKSAFYETYQPYADNLIAKIRELAPQAEIVIQQTWSYAPYAMPLKKWNMTPSQMYESLKKAYAQLAAKHGLRIIPTADAVQLFRERLPVDYGKLLTEDEIGKIEKPAVVDFHGDVVGSSSWKRGSKRRHKDWQEVKLRNDFTHFNARGHYLQACVWLGFLFSIDPVTFTYCPKSLPEADARLMRECARDALQSLKSR